jgi:Capsular polysaccharide synthesis protein.
MKIYTMWEQGLDAAPSMVKRIHDIWVAQEGEENIHFVAGEESNDLLSDKGVDPKPLTAQMRADLIRLALLESYGGTWVDATLLPSSPLNYWLNEKREPAGFFAHSNPKIDRIVDVWFLSALPGNTLVSAWHDALFEYFQKPRLSYKQAPKWDRLKREIRIAIAPASFASDTVARKAKYFPYHIIAYTLDNLLRHDKALAAQWDMMPKVTGALAVELKSECFKTHGKPDPETLARLFHGFPVHKLNWRAEGAFDDAIALAEKNVGIVG